MKKNFEIIVLFSIFYVFSDKLILLIEAALVDGDIFEILKALNVKVELKKVVFEYFLIQI